MDAEYQVDSALRSRHHPRGIWEGFVQGIHYVPLIRLSAFTYLWLTLAFLELGRGFYHGVTGLGVLPYRGAGLEGFAGFLKGMGRALLGLPLKPLAGFFEFQRIFYDGILHALGRGTYSLPFPYHSSLSSLLFYRDSH
jgi:hypothetical protein